MGYELNPIFSNDVLMIFPVSLMMLFILPETQRTPHPSSASIARTSSGVISLRRLLAVVSKYAMRWKFWPMSVAAIFLVMGLSGSGKPLRVASVVSAQSVRPLSLPLSLCLSFSQKWMGFFSLQGFTD